MKMFIIIARSLLFLIIFKSYPVLADPGWKFGKIPDSEVLKTSADYKVSAEALVLFNKGNTVINYQNSTGFVITYKIHKVIKVLSKDGVGFGDLQIPYYDFSGSLDKVINVKGFTYNPVGGKVQKQKLEKDHVFDEVQSKTFHIKKITPPNVKEGSIIEIYYEISSDLFSYIREWEFQEEIPTVYSEYNFEYPEYFIYGITSQGYLPFNVEDNSFGNGQAVWTERERSESGYVVTSTVSSGSVKYKTNIKRWVVENAPALKPEPFVDNPKSYATKIATQLQFTQFPNSPIKPVSGTWASLNEGLIKDVDFGKHLGRSKAISDLKAKIDLEGMSERQKLETIHKLVGSTVKWDGTRGIYLKKNLERVIKEGKGSISEINFILISLLRESGFSAYPVVSSTRDLGFLNMASPIMYKLNYVTALVEAENGEILLDASEPYLPVGLLPLRAINFKGWVVKPEAGRWVEMENNFVNTESSLVKLKLADGFFNKEVKKSSHGYNSVNVKGKILSNGLEDYRLSLRSELKADDILDLTVENIYEKEKPSIEGYTLKSSAGFIDGGDFIYFSPFEGDRFFENPFRQDERVYPVDFLYAQRKQAVMEIEIPEGYVVDMIPKSAIFSFDDKSLQFNYRIANSNDKVNISLTFLINRTLYPSTEYLDLKNLFDHISEKMKESIVLKKI